MTKKSGTLSGFRSVDGRIVLLHLGSTSRVDFRKDQATGTTISASMRPRMYRLDCISKTVWAQFFRSITGSEEHVSTAGPEGRQRREGVSRF